MTQFKHNPERLPDGRDVIGTLPASYEVGVTTAYFPTLAKREGLQRFAKRNSKGHLSFYWLVDEVANLKAKRNGIEAVVPFDEVVPLPYEDEQA